MKAGNNASGKNSEPGLDVDDEDGTIVCYDAVKVDDDGKDEMLPDIVDKKRGREEQQESSNKR